MFVAAVVTVLLLWARGRHRAIFLSHLSFPSFGVKNDPLN